MRHVNNFLEASHDAVKLGEKLKVFRLLSDEWQKEKEIQRGIW